MPRSSQNPLPDLHQDGDYQDSGFASGLASEEPFIHSLVIPLQQSPSGKKDSSALAYAVSSKSGPGQLKDQTHVTSRHAIHSDRDARMDRSKMQPRSASPQDPHLTPNVPSRKRRHQSHYPASHTKPRAKLGRSQPPISLEVQNPRRVNSCDCRTDRSHGPDQPYINAAESESREEKNSKPGAAPPEKADEPSPRMANKLDLSFRLAKPSPRGRSDDFVRPDEDDHQPSEDEDPEDGTPVPVDEPLKEPGTNPISQEQLAAEVKGIYSGLRIIEAKCIEVMSVESRSKSSKSPKELRDLLRTLIGLHRQLLHEHHDFFLASQHPSALPQIKELASKHSMPARMWKHGIHTFLEFLRHKLPQSLDHMLSFIYIAYQMMALLYETVTSFEETWIECLGDIARYRMAIEDVDPYDRHVWTGVAKYWYSKAVDKNPGTGRLYHHLAILARHEPLQQLSSYCRSLTAQVPFLSTRDSIMTLMGPLLTHLSSSQSKAMPISRIFVATQDLFIAVHAILFTEKFLDLLPDSLTTFTERLDTQVEEDPKPICEAGENLAISNIASVLDYGTKPSRIMQSLSGTSSADASLEADYASRSRSLQGVLPCKWRLLFETLRSLLRKPGAEGVMRHVHIILAFTWLLTSLPDGSEYLSDAFPWESLAHFLNLKLGKISYATGPKLEHDGFPQVERGDRQLLPEDFLMRGQKWARKYHPPGAFDEMNSDEEERMMEYGSTNQIRTDRLVWLGIRLARARDTAPAVSGVKQSMACEGRRKWLHYEPRAKRDGRSSGFSVQEKPFIARRVRTLPINLRPPHNSGLGSDSSAESGSDESSGEWNT